jgi:hypothetical protein
LIFLFLGLGFGVWGLGFGVWGLGFGVWGLGFDFFVLGFGVWGLGFGVWGLGFGVWCLVFVIWGLGFGVWGVGFGVWGLGFGRFGGCCLQTCKECNSDRHCCMHAIRLFFCASKSNFECGKGKVEMCSWDMLTSACATLQLETWG